MDADRRPTVAAVIPARGGSKGISRKNLQCVGGVSLIGRAVIAAKHARSVDRVIVSSDDAEILREAREYDAETHRRSPANSSDEASSEAALIEVIGDHSGADNIDILVFLQCTSPFLDPADIEALLAPVASGEVDTTFSAVPFHGFQWQHDVDGVTEPIGHSRESRARRQDQQSKLLETGGIYVMRVEGLLSSSSRFHGRTKAIEVDPLRSMEIDTHLDLEIAQALVALFEATRTNDTRTSAAMIEVAQNALLPTLEDIDLVVLDFDGVFTDDRVFVDSEGRETVVCDRSDGRAIQELSAEVGILVLSSEVNPVVRARCDKLGLEVSQGHGASKRAALRNELDRRRVAADRVLYVGNDTNDVECLSLVAYPFVVQDATPSARSVAKFVLSRRGGRGALKELAETLLGRPT